MKILSVVGNRPQFVKSAPLSAALADVGLTEVVLHTGQHWDRELSAVFFEELGLGAPAYELDLRTADVEAMTRRIEEVVRDEAPDQVLVYGDTSSTLAGARAAAAAGVPVAHVEAGLRSGDLEMPEERARIEVDRLAELLFAPDERSRATLAARGSRRTRRGRRRRDGGREPPLRSGRAPPPSRARSGDVRRRDRPPRGKRVPAPPGTDRRRAGPPRGARRLSGAPADASVARGGRGSSSGRT